MVLKLSFAEFSAHVRAGPPSAEETVILKGEAFNTYSYYRFKVNLKPIEAHLSGEDCVLS